MGLSAALLSPVVPARSRWQLLLPLLLLPVLGLGSRSGAAWLPSFVSAYAGDTLWTMMMYVSLLFVWPRLSLSQAAGWALAISFAVELSQMYRAPWIDAVREHRLGALFLGRGFLESDLVCYSVGALLAAGLDGLLAWRRTEE
ncbi:DUF2809 domain-containing protein [Hyalangium sp.]|uniref:ribosomal maturation YjgA family protein n=1 Tax=Hyalangium sp. TaxID=2028555 RepID=UPI002D3F2BF0|nr:DUF2809 domain-containing protein [Hyalangium sp.]HYH96275.1 DUF2809 domain-containing protein [Hyalangium sp.]